MANVANAGEWGAFGMVLAVSAPLLLGTAYRRRLRFDADGDGTIAPEEVPYLLDTLDRPVRVDRPSYGDMTLLSPARVFVEAMMHAFCYGCTIVFSMNLFMLHFVAMERRYAYLAAVGMICMGTMFMCSVATNGIHVATSLPIHVLYYGHAYASLFYLWKTPEQECLVPLAAVLALVLYVVGRRIEFPNRPTVVELVRFYEYQTEEDAWRLASKPNLHRRMTNHTAGYDAVRRDDDDDDGVGQMPDFPPANGKSKLENLTSWAVVFPAFEIMNTLLSSSFTLGVLVGTIVGGLAGRFGQPASVSVLAVSVVLAAAVGLAYQSQGLFGSIENDMHLGVLANFFPKTASVLLAMTGAAAVVIQLEPIERLEGTTTDAMVYRVGVGALLVNIATTFGVSVWAYYSQVVGRRQ